MSAKEASSPHHRGPGALSKRVAPVLPHLPSDGQSSPRSATAELQAVNIAFATQEQGLRAEILAQQAECDRLGAAQHDLGNQLAAALQEREALALLEVKARDETNAMATRLAEAEALWSAQRAQSDADLEKTRQQSSDAQQALEAARSLASLLQAEVAAAQAIEADWASRNAEQASAIQSLHLENSKSAVAASDRAKAERTQLDSRILELEQALATARAHHAQLQLALKEDAERIRSNLSEINLTAELQRTELAAAAEAHRLGTQVLHANLTARDRQIAEVQLGLDTSAAQAREYREQLVLARAAAQNMAQAHEARVRGLRESAHHELRKQADELAVRHDAVLGSLTAEARGREAAVAAQHQQQLEVLQSGFAALEAAQGNAVLTLQARLQDASAREQQLAEQLGLGRTQIESFIEGHMGAMRALSELHATERRKWLSQQANGQAVAVDSLLCRLQEEAAEGLALRAELVALRRALQAQESQAMEVVEVVEVAQAPAPSAHLPALRAAAMQAAEAGAVTTAGAGKVDDELAVLRNALLAERQHHAALAQQLLAPARSSAATDAAPPTEHEENSATAPENLAGLIAVPAAVASDSIEEENKTMSVPPSLDEILALYDEDFVRAVYSATLHRAPDPAGLQSYLTRLRGGQPKESIFLALAQSPEGQQIEATRDVAQVLQQRLAMQQGNKVARLLRRLLGLDGARSFNRADAAENRLGVKLSALAISLTATERRLADRVQEQHRQSQFQEQQRQSQQIAALSAALTGQIADSLAKLTHRLDEADQSQARLELVVAQSAKVVEATLAGLQQVQELVREESRRTRAVVGSGQATALNPPPGWPAAEVVVEKVVDPAAFARVREMLMTKANGS